MNSDLLGATGSPDPGLDELFRTLTSDPAPGELAGEQDAVAMFRANVHPSPGPASASPAAAPVRSAAPARRLARPFRSPVRWGLRLTAAAAVALAGGTAAAAYAAALPAPVQHLAHQVLGFAGVPEPHQSTLAPSPRRHHRGSAASHPATSPGQATPSRHVATPHPSPSSHHSASPTPSPSVASGPALLSASTTSSVIPAGSGVTIDGQLTMSNAGVPGMTVMLLEHLAGQPGWHLAGTGQTNSDGNVAVTVAALTGNAAFRLRTASGVHSTNVRVVVTPVVTVVLTEGPAGLHDLLAVTTQYARAGNFVELQVQLPGGWTYLRAKRLTAAGTTRFALNGTRLQGDLVRVVLLATLRHGAAVSNTPQVPAPS